MTSNFERYLKILGVPKQNLSLQFLTQIVGAYIAKIPFENISKVYYFKKEGLKDIPTLTQYLEGIELHHFGGTCYSNNFYLNQLLKSLGFQVKLCGANMKEKDVHLVNLIELDGREYFVDVGYAAPFIQPIPRDLDSDFKISHGDTDYVLCPQDKKGYSELRLYRNGEHKHGYHINPKSRHISEFNDIIEQSFWQESRFMKVILLARFEQNYSQVIHNMTYIETVGSKSNKRSFKTRDELIVAIKEVFKIPAKISRYAIDEMPLSESAWD